jgi:uncharacterized FAD-dependent dehydrogenase
MILVDGTKFHPSSKNTSFNVITSMNALGFTHQDGRSVVRGITSSTHGYPVVQRMKDFRDGNPSAADSVRGGPVRRTLSLSRAGNMSPHLPDQVRAEIINFIDLMSNRFPGASAGDNLVYAPVFEWFYRKVVLDKKSWTSTVPGLFVIGDVAGLSQGVVMACASGIRAAFAIDSFVNQTGR